MTGEVEPTSDDRELHIALVIEHFDPSGGGAERSTAQIAQGLAARGHRVTIIAGCYPNRDDLDFVEVNALSRRRSSSAVRLWQFANWAPEQLEEGQFDVTLSVTTAVAADIMQPRGGTMRETFDRNIAMRASAFKRNVKQASLAISAKRRLLLGYERATMRSNRVQRFIAVSDYVARQLVEHYNIDEDRITVIPNAATIEYLNVKEKQAFRSTLRGAYQVPDRTTAFLFVALNPALKGFGTLVRAMRLLIDRQVRTTLLVVTRPSQRLTRQIAEAGVADQVRIVGLTQHMAELYCAADVTVHPTWYDPSSKVVIESLMSGVPAITTRYNGAADLMEGKRSQILGRIIDDPADAAALADAMQDLANHKTRKAIEIDRKALAKQLSMDRHVEQLEVILRQVAASRAESSQPSSDDEQAHRENA